MSTQSAVVEILNNRSLAALAGDLRAMAVDVAGMGRRGPAAERAALAATTAAGLRRLAEACEGPSALPFLLDRLDRRIAPDPPPAAPPEGYRRDAKGRFVPAALVRPEDALEDQTARQILAFGLDLADQIARFRQHSYEDMATLLDILTAKYGGGRQPGRKGNYSIKSFDGRFRVVIQVQDRLTFGPELQVARQLVDECIADWSEGSRDEIRVLVQHAFQPDAEGRVNREAIFKLRRLDIDDDRWQQARHAIDDSIRVEGTRMYLRLYCRPAPDAAWRPVPIDLASDWSEPDDAGGGVTRDVPTESEYVRTVLRLAADAAREHLPPEWSVTLLVFPTDAPPDETNVHYISSVDRTEMCDAVQVWLRRQRM